MYRIWLKRFFDVLLAGSSLVLLSPVLLLAAVAIRLEDGGPALFRQTRVGRNGQPFTMLKFRTMPVNSPNVPSSQAEVVRITRVGAVLRRTNVDELPQLVNILRGDMSIVGPRPALPVQSELLAIRWENGAVACRPGLTGLAQVNSYDGMPEHEKAAWDGKYAGEVTLLGDLTIVLQTFRYLSKRPPTY